MFMKNLMKGKMPKTQEEMIQEQREQELQKRQKFQLTDELIKQVHRKTQPILAQLGMQRHDDEDSDMDIHINKDDLIPQIDQQEQYKDVKLLAQKNKQQDSENNNNNNNNNMKQQDKLKKPYQMSYEEIEKKLQDLEDMKIRAAHSNYLNLFGVERGRCQQPQCMKICPQYRGSYNIKSYSGIELFSCINCKCPMNSHEIPVKEQTFSNQLSEELSNKYIESNHLNFKSLVAIFLVWPKEEEPINPNKKVPDFIKKRRKQQAKIYNANLEKLVQIFNEGCFDILSYYDASSQQVFDKLVEKKIFSIKKPIPKQDMDSFISFIKSFQKADNQAHKKKKTENIRNLLNNERDLSKFQMYQRYKEKIQNKFDIISHQNKKEIDQARVYILLISSKYSNPYTQFRKFLVAAKANIPGEFIYYYSSKYKYKGIIDCQQFFPDFFKINYQTFILAQHIPKKVMLQSKADSTISQERIQKKQEEIKEREVKKNDDKLRDYLDFNNFVIIEEDFSQKQSQLGKAFDFIDEDEDNRLQFFKFCQVGANSLNIKICAKIGPPTYTTIGGDAPNVYRITDEYDNENIASHLCDELNYSQRVAVVLRPIIVKSKMDEVLLNIFRINDFIVVNRVFCLLTLEQAKLLAKLEGVTDENRVNYINMMREGIVQIILLTKPGGLKSVQILSNGCQTGLKLQKTNYLDELYVQHEQGGVVFREMIQKQFFNVFQSYTNLNMFSGIQEFFNIEKLIFQDNQNDEEETGSIFINQSTKQVHYEGKQQVVVNQGKRYTALKRNQIVEDINSETFNFFVFCPSGELSTEQIVSVFMPECANIQLIHIILKPQYLMYLDNVQKLLEKLKYKVWNIKKLMIPNAHDAKQFVESLQVLKNINSSGIETQYNTEQFAILSCVKPAGRKEMLSFLQDFKVEYIRGEVFEPIITTSLKYMLIPCHTDESHDLAQHYINPKSRSFTGEEFLNMKIEDQAICSRFMLECTFATGLSFENNQYYIKEKIINNPLYPTQFIHFIIKSQDLGLFEVRIHDPNNLKPYEIDYKYLTQSFKLTSWYYSLINKQYMQRCPLSYQYRLMPDYKNFEQNFKNKNNNEIPTHIFDVSEYCGGFFLETVAEQMKLYRKYEITEEQKNLLRKNNEDTFRGSVAAYLWGMRLAKFVKEMERLDYPNIEGFGPILLKGDKYEGDLADNDELEDNIMQKYRDILEKIRKQLEMKKNDLGGMNNSSQQYQDSHYMRIERIKSKIQQICHSETFKYSRQKQMRRILPGFVENENLRVRVDNRQIYKRFLNQEYQTQDEFYEQRNQEINLKPDIKKLEVIIDNLQRLEKLESENKFDNESLKKRLKEEDTTFDAIDLKKRAQFLDDDSYMILLLHQITTKKNKIYNLLKSIEQIEEDQKNKNKFKDEVQIESIIQKEYQDQEESDFSIKKHLIYIEEVNQYIVNLNEKYNGKNGAFNLSTATRINNFSFAYVLPEIKSKYSLAANILYLIDVQFKSISTKYHLTDNDHDEYKQLITAIEEGFKNHYQIDSDDLTYLREKYQDKMLIQRDKSIVQIPDFIKIEQFFVYLTQMERNLTLVEEKNNIFTRILDEKTKEIKGFKDRMTQERPDESEWRKIEEKWDPITNKIMNDKKQIESQIIKLLQELDNFEINFDYKKSMQSDSSQTSNKKDIRYKNMFFFRSEKLSNKVIENEEYDKFFVDIMDITYKYDKDEINPNKKSNPKNRREPLLEKYGDREFLQDAQKDALQKDWFFRPPLLISHMRPTRGDERDYILVDNIEQDNKLESELAIQKEIRRFKNAVGMPLDDQDDEEKMEQKMKHQDYAEFKRQQMKKEYQQQQLMDERYHESNPQRSANIAQDIIDNYIQQIKEEKKKIEQERYEQEKMARYQHQNQHNNNNYNRR